MSEPTMPVVKKGKEHPFLSAELYEPCHACKGTLTTQTPMMVDGLVRTDATGTYSGTLSAGAQCPLCDGIGFVKIGMTVGDLERLRGRYDLLTYLLVCLLNSNMATARGDAVTDSELLRLATDAARKIPGSDLTVATEELRKKGLCGTGPFTAAQLKNG